MAQRYRLDHVGAWLHVMNRGIARRPIFTTRALIEEFLDLLEKEVEAGWIEIHALSILTTHFHLLVRSLRGESFRALMHAANVYARSFNRAARRDGPLFRGRFRSAYVASEMHWRNVVRYIDFNPVEARMAAAPADYPFGSARVYAGLADLPWLTRDVVNAVVLGDTGEATVSPSAYTRVFGRGPTDAERHCVESRIEVPGRSGDALDDLVAAAPAQVREWMRRKSLVADGTAAGPPVLRPETLLAAISRSDAALAPRLVKLSGRARNVLPILRAGLLRTATGASWSRIAESLGVTAPAAHGNGTAHVRLLALDAAYADLCAAIVTDALAVEWPDARTLRFGAVPILSRGAAAPSVPAA